MKIVIIGPGAMGCLLAAYLSKTKNDIFLLDKDPQRAKKIQEKGISVKGVSGSWLAKVRALADVNEIGKADLVIVAVKSYDTKEALKNLKDLLAEDGLVLSLQNGIGNIEVISEFLSAEKVLGGITNHGATLLDIGSINHAGIGETIIGRLDGKIPVGLRWIRDEFNKSGLQLRISRDIKSVLWSKLIINAGINALSAVTRLHNGKLSKIPWTRKILTEAVSEAVKVARRKRIKLIYDDPISKVEAVCESTSGNISSMLQDVLRSKRTEIDFINGVIVRHAEALGIPVPVNSVLTNLVKAVEDSYELRVSLALCA